MNTIVRPKKALGWTIWLTASFFYAYQYVLRVMPNICLTEIMEKFDMTTSMFGQFTGIYYVGYSLMHLPVGILLDRFGPRKIMSLSILLVVLGLLPLIYTDIWVYPTLGRLLIGIGSSASILGVFKVIRVCFEERHFSKFLGLSATMGLLGAIYGGKPIDQLKTTLGFQSIVELIAIFGLLLSLITFLIVPNSKEETKGSISSDILEVLKNKKVFLCSFFAGLMVGPLEGFADVWAVAYLKNVHGYENAASATLPSIIFFGMCFGAPVLGIIAEKIGNLFITVIGSGLLMALSFFSLLFFNLPQEATAVSFFIVGVASAYQVLTIQKASTFVRPHVVGLTMAIVNMIVMIFGYGFHTVMGGLIQFLGGPNSPYALQIAVSVVPLCLIIGSLGFVSMFLLEKRELKKA